MFTKWIRMTLLLGLLAPIMAQAEDARLAIESDLVVHPEEMSSVLQRLGSELNKKPALAIEQMDVQSPVRSTLSRLKTSTPLTVSLDTTNLSSQTLQFTASWSEPALAIGELVIDDKIQRHESGGHFIIRLRGRCEGLTLRQTAGAPWTLRGTARWHWRGSQAVFEVTGVELTRQSSTIQVEMGRCEIAPALKADLERGVRQVLENESRLQEVFRAGLERWLNDRSPDLEKELMTPRLLQTAQNVSVRWLPRVLDAREGLVVVRGVLELSRSGLTKGSSATVPRDPAMNAASALRGSGFLLPKASLRALTEFAARAQLLENRFSSRRVDAMKGLFDSRLAQFFLFKDLIRFKLNTEFWFDFKTQGDPKFVGVENEENEDGIRVLLKSSVLLKMWAPESGQYVPYIDFTSPANGALSLAVRDSHLAIGYEPETLNFKYKFSDDYRAAHPKAHTAISIQSFQKRLQRMLQGKTWHFPLPRIPVPGAQSLGLSQIEWIDAGVLLRLESQPQSR